MLREGRVGDDEASSCLSAWMTANNSDFEKSKVEEMYGYEV
jgi:hypothetical protein